MKTRTNFTNTPAASFVIFGATSDLARKKLMPALLDLFVKNLLPKHFRVIGFSRRPDWTDNDFREFVRDSIKKKKHQHPANKINKFLRNLVFQHGYFDELDAFRQLRRKLLETDKNIKACANKLFYLAVPPSFYGKIFTNLKKSKLTGKYEDENCARVLVEKPFGRDLKTAIALDKKLAALFNEKQIFRIDHYLAKETMQNIVAFRFANSLFEPVWNRNHIARVEIIFHEKEGVTGRADTYDGIGALRDVGQNHLLQMLALIAMEDPIELDAQKIRQERARVLENLQPISAKNLSRYAQRGQYRGYSREDGVAPNSQTETFFRTQAYIGNQRWQGVPFILESGKKMKETRKEIKIYFKEKETCVCDLGDNQCLENVLTFQLEPNEGISTLFWAKKPGFTMEVEPRQMHFSYHEGKEMITDAYEKILYDCLRGDQMLFASTEEVLAAWRFITPILKNFNKIPLKIY